ncbi:hypothetical protein SAMN05428946_0601 [Edaphobacillus lindanitolerans]|uniref:Uncharacterized protein n=1 Tax=Edaphobacillus lindanitolerans TaxID=550447 RepID=A0A1U7PMP1_9BACI|nr:hypothetical protein SAMN05428946_0601 [Edaphobacillus lindanitolerans]
MNEKARSWGCSGLFGMHEGMGNGGKVSGHFCNNGPKQEKMRKPR